MVYKCMDDLTPDYLRTRFQRRSEIHQRDTRQKNNLSLPKYRLTSGQRAFAFRGAKVFNSLPKFIGFKRRIFKHIFSSYFVRCIFLLFNFNILIFLVLSYFNIHV